MKFKDLTGQKFGRLIAMHVDKSKKGTYWACKCDCGRWTVVNSGKLINGHTKSCGCLQKEMASSANKTHGMCGTTEYKTWAHLISRCNDINDISYKNYGGRGISVCEEWKESFEKFYKDMGNRPSRSYQLDRINNDLGYFKNNCRWILKTYNTINRRGLEYKSSKYKGVSWNTQKNKWVSQIQINHKSHYIGSFVNEEDAATAYNKKALELFGEYAYLNKID